MEYVRLGKSGLQVSRLCLGMMTYGDPAWREWVLTEEQGRPFVQRAIEAGINFFDTADVYSDGVSEQITGRLLAEFAKREDVVIATKVFFPHTETPNRGGLSRKHIFAAIDRSLKNLNTDYVDLYQIHRWDHNTPVEETMEALHDVVKAGKARYIGGGSTEAWVFARAQYTADLHGWTRFVSMQHHYNLLHREEEREMIPQCIDMGVGLMPWSPLARGILAGTRTREGAQTLRAETDTLMAQRYTRELDYEIVDEVKAVATELGVSAAQVALAWLLHKPGITAPIIGASKPYHLDDALAAVTLKLDASHIARLEACYQPQLPKY
jgi:aryl-alcohol dehydrogenase (NADP+)